MHHVRLGDLSLNQRLAALAFASGLVALAAQPHPGPRASLDVQVLAGLVQTEADHVTPQELADWIVKERSDYRLLDLRDAASFARYHIPTAENVPLADLARAEIAPTETVVLYSEGGIHGAQAWLLLRAKGLKAAYNLKGGLEAWKDDILFPILPERPSGAETERVERALALARFFGGGPRIAGAQAVTANADLPKLPVPAAVPVPTAPSGAGPARKPKKKEGC